MLFCGETREVIYVMYNVLMEHPFGAAHHQIVIAFKRLKELFRKPSLYGLNKCLWT